MFGGLVGRGDATRKRQSSETIDCRIERQDERSSGTRIWPLLGDEDWRRFPGDREIRLDFLNVDEIFESFPASDSRFLTSVLVRI